VPCHRRELIGQAAAELARAASVIRAAPVMPLPSSHGAAQRQARGHGVASVQRRRKKQLFSGFVLVNHLNLKIHSQEIIAPKNMK
jgi:hypothetical protein